jgi:hypothetical protein
METDLNLVDHKILDIASKTGEERGTVNFYIDRFSQWMKNPDSIDNERNLVAVYIKLYNRYGSKSVARAEVARRIKLAREIRKLREMVLEHGKLAACQGSQSAWDSIYTMITEVALSA